MVPFQNTPTTTVELFRMQILADNMLFACMASFDELATCLQSIREYHIHFTGTVLKLILMADSAMLDTMSNIILGPWNEIDDIVARREHQTCCPVYSSLL